MPEFYFDVPTSVAAAKSNVKDSARFAYGSLRTLIIITVGGALALGTGGLWIAALLLFLLKQAGADIVLNIDNT